MLWKMGGATASKDNATYVAVADAFHGQHDRASPAGWCCPPARGDSYRCSTKKTIKKAAPAVIYDVVVGGGDAGTAGCDGGTPGGAEAGTAKVVFAGCGLRHRDGELPDRGRWLLRHRMGYLPDATLVFTELRRWTWISSTATTDDVYRAIRYRWPRSRLDATRCRGRSLAKPRKGPITLCTPAPASR